MKLAGYDTAATLTIKKAADMTPKGRRKIADWLREKAEDLVVEGQNYTSRFTTGYWYKEQKMMTRPQFTKTLLPSKKSPKPCKKK